MAKKIPVFNLSNGRVHLEKENLRLGRCFMRVKTLIMMKSLDLEGG
ncbi:hypothetical protein B4166_1789 [Caldibacillus thermoamylovorans]|uniref:Uncharacterized protein n=1 Tax=Caldibacillus thermoamylovorans TaxID=35841 RepID=A0ABD4A7B3_9BACI|nr:hypothetical protein B4166_1789 [Caldibacillus thermoamylovorans]KIO72882.1 hypothetical protein B4167_2658 [Caldibacillus thermoamylovorans]